MRDRFLTAVILGLAGFVLCACGPRLRFSTHSCDRSVGRKQPKRSSGILTTRWVRRNTLRVGAWVKTYCSGARIRGDYQLQGRRLSLLYTVKAGPRVSRCVCPRGVRYEISGLKRGVYAISIGRK